MLNDIRVGNFYCDRMIGGRTMQHHTWRLTSDFFCVARIVSRVLGGEVSKFGNAAWEVVTEAQAIPVLLEEVHARGVVFRIASVAHIGSFFFESRHLTLDSNSLGSHRILIRPVLFETRTGLRVLYLLPEVV